MSDPGSQLDVPQDLAGCHALIDELIRRIAEQSETIEENKREIEKLNLEMAELIRRMMIKRSERYIEDPNQLKIDFGSTDDIDDAVEGLKDAVEEVELTIPEHKRRKRKRQPRNEKFPEHLERREVEAEVPESVSHCQEHGPRKIIGYDTVETLHFQRPQLWVEVTKYPKFACEGDAECGVASPERPTGLVEGNRYAPSVAAEVVAAKLEYHLPLYRQQNTFASCGWIPARSTLVNLFAAAAFTAKPLAEHILEQILATGLVGTDETRTTLLLPKDIPKPEDDLKSQRIHEVFRDAVAEGKHSVSGRMWAYRSFTVPLNAFDFTVSRHRDGPDLVLAKFQGKLMADCYSGYQGIALRSNGRIQRAACATHARRKVFEARGEYPVESSFLLSRFVQLYDIETRAKNYDAAARQELRMQEAKPIWDAMGEWLDGDVAARVLPKGNFGKALGYLRNHWEPLQLYLTDGNLPIDNNDAEQLMKQIATGRKNWLFVGSVAAGERMADLMTLVSSAIRNDLDVWAYLNDVLTRLLAGETDYELLRPDIWRQSHPEAVREYRSEERRDRADRKQVCRARRRASITKQRRG